ncbi:MAG: hypothetical protein WEB13_07885 [Dehalococcoidia bacterium]
MSGEHVGILIIRAWTEQGSRVQLRAHVRQTTDVSAGLQGGTTVTDEDAVVELVRTWLGTILLSRSPPADVGSR